MIYNSDYSLSATSCRGLDANHKQEAPKKEWWPASGGDNGLHKVMYFTYHNCECLNGTYEAPTSAHANIKKQPNQHFKLHCPPTASLDSPWKRMTSVHIRINRLRESFIITLIWFLPYLMQKSSVEKLQNESEISLRMQNLNDMMLSFFIS